MKVAPEMFKGPWRAVGRTIHPAAGENYFTIVTLGGVEQDEATAQALCEFVNWKLEQG